MEFPSDQEWKRVAALPRAPPGGQAREAPRFPFQEALRAGVINQQCLDPRTAPCSVPPLSWPCPLGLWEMKYLKLTSDTALGTSDVTHYI